MKAYKQLATVLFLFLLTAVTFADTPRLNATSFKDQWDKPLELTAEVKWLIVSQDRDASKLVRESLQELGLTDLESKAALYIADISAMPGIITKMFALPKMRDYPFRMALLTDEDAFQTLALPEMDASAVNVLQLNSLDVIKLMDFADKVSFKDFLQEQLLADTPGAEKLQ